MRLSSWLLLACLVLSACSGDVSDLAGDVGTPSGVGWSPSASPAPSATEDDPSQVEAPTGASEPVTTQPDPDPQEAQAPDTVASPSEGPSMPTGGGGEEPGTSTQDPDAPDTTTVAAPRAPGTYRYDTDGYMEATGGDRRSLPDITTLDVHDARSGTQRAARDVRDADGRGQINDTTTIYRDEGVFLSRVKVITDLGGGVRDEREWVLDPPELLVSTGAEPGYRRTFTMGNGDTNAEVTVELLRRETITVGGQAVDTVVTQIHIELSGSVEGSQTTVAWTRPSDLLTVQEHVQSDTSNGPFRVRMDYQATLRSLEPSR